MLFKKERVGLRLQDDDFRSYQAVKINNIWYAITQKNYNGSNDYRDLSKIKIKNWRPLSKKIAEYYKEKEVEELKRSFELKFNSCKDE